MTLLHVSPVQAQSHSMKVELRLSETLVPVKSGGLDPLAKRFGDRLRELLDDLVLPIQPELSVTPAADADLLHQGYYDILINGVQCGVDMSRTPEQDPLALGEHAGSTLHRNRDLFVSDGLADALLPDAQSPNDAPPEGALRDILSRAVRLGLGTLNARTAAAALGKMGWKGVDLAYGTETFLAMGATGSIVVELGRELYGEVHAPGEEFSFSADETFGMMADGLFYELGIRFPPPVLAFSETLGPRDFRVRINQVRGSVQAGLRGDEVLVNDTVDRLTLLNITGREAVNPANGKVASIVPRRFAEIYRMAGLTSWDSPAYVVLAVAGALRRQAAEYFSTGLMEATLRRLDEAFPMPVFNVLERFPIGELTEIIRSLLWEDVSVRDLRSILEALLEAGQAIEIDFGREKVFPAREAHPVLAPPETPRALQLVEAVRVALRRQIINSITDGRTTLWAFRLSPEIEDRVGRPGGEPMEPAEQRLLFAALEEVVRKWSRSLPHLTILTHAGIRRRLRALIALEFPSIRVVSFDEVSPDYDIRIMQQIALTEASPRVARHATRDS